MVNVSVQFTIHHSQFAMLPSPDWLAQKADVEEREFESPTPYLGPLLVWFRTAWNNVATKWYVRPIVQQQNEFNRRVVECLRVQDGLIDDSNARLIEQDREQTELVRQLALLTTEMATLSRQMAILETRLAHLESKE